MGWFIKMQNHSESDFQSLLASLKKIPLVGDEREELLAQALEIIDNSYSEIALGKLQNAIANIVPKGPDQQYVLNQCANQRKFCKKNKK